MLRKLIQRFDVPLLNLEEQQYPPLTVNYYETTVVYEVRRRVLEIIHNWVDKYYFDFDDEMVKTLSTFLDEQLKKFKYLTVIINEIKKAMHLVCENIFKLMN